MALEAVVLSQQGSRFGCGAMAGGPWSGLFGGAEGMLEEMGGASSGSWDWDAAARSSPPPLLHGFQEELVGDAPAAAGALPAASGGSGSATASGAGVDAVATTAAAAGRRKRRRARAVRNKEEVESQRMIHIAVERNRRKQMNEYLAALRSLMPPAYAQRGDQASIVGGAINFVKELEQLLQTLETHRRSRQRPTAGDTDGADDAAPFAGFFTFPQYSMRVAAAPETNAPADDAAHRREGEGEGEAEAEETSSGSKPSAVADVEATMVESHANLRVVSRRRPRQLLRLVVGLQGHRLTVLHLNMSSAGHMVLYSFSLKVEDDCQLTSVDEIATVAHQIVEKIHQEQRCPLE